MGIGEFRVDWFVWNLNFIILNVITCQSCKINSKKGFLYDISEKITKFIAAFETRITDKYVFYLEKTLKNRKIKTLKLRDNFRRVMFQISIRNTFWRSCRKMSSSWWRIGSDSNSAALATISIRPRIFVFSVKDIENSSIVVCWKY